MSSPVSSANTRRTFLTACAGCAVTTLLPGCGGLRYVPATLRQNRLVFAKAAFGDQRCIGIDHPRLQGPIAVCRIGSDGYSAVGALCTHKACELRYADDTLECPCHGSRFSLAGEVLQDPAEKPLPRFPVEADATHIYIGGKP